MNDEQKQLYEDSVQKYKMQNYSSSEDVKKLILRDLRYSDTHLINPQLMLNIDEYFEDPEEQALHEVYIFAGFMKPGKQCYSIAIPGTDLTDGQPDLQYFTHKAIIPNKLSDVSHFSQADKQSKVVREFSKPHSVFCLW